MTLYQLQNDLGENTDTGLPRQLALPGPSSQPDEYGAGFHLLSTSSCLPLTLIRSSSVCTNNTQGKSAPDVMLFYLHDWIF